MELQEQFNNAVIKSKELPERPGNEDLLLLYALFKQSTEGDVVESRPQGFDFKAIAKHDAWTEQKGKSKEAAMQEYVNLVSRLQQS